MNETDENNQIFEPEDYESDYYNIKVKKNIEKKFFVIFLYQNTSKSIRTYMGTSLNIFIFTYMDFKKMSIWEKTGTEK